MRQTILNFSILTLSSTFLPLAGCVGGSTAVTEKDKKKLAQYVLDAAPKDIPKKLKTNFDNKITLIGYRVEPSGVVKPGQKVKLTMYWRCDNELGQDGWNLFTHVLDGSGERILNIDNVGPLREWRETRQIMWPSGWKKGKFYVDQQEFTVPKSVKTAKIQVVTGIWKGNERLKIVSGAKDREKRAIVANLGTGVKPSAQRPKNTRVPELRVNRLEKGATIKIDGKLDENAWKTAATTRKFVDVKTGAANTKFPVNGSVKVLWNDSSLFLGFDVKDPDIIGGFKPGAKDPKLWTKDTVEIMVDPDGDGDNKDYYEIQVSPQNLVFDSRFDSYNKPKKEPNGPFGHQDWSAQLKSAVTIDGTLDKAGDKDKGYIVEIEIPWKSFDKAKQVPPKLGDTWRMNFYAMEKKSGVAWSPILSQGNFHKASRFGKVTWAEKGWSPPGVKANRPKIRTGKVDPGGKVPVLQLPKKK